MIENFKESPEEFKNYDSELLLKIINKKYEEIMRQADNAVGRKEVVSLLKKAALIMSKSEENLAA